MENEICEFIGENMVATICCVKDGLPHCFNCVYAVCPGMRGIVFKSSRSSVHSGVMKKAVPVAGTIYRASENVLNNTGIQFVGRVVVDHQGGDDAEKAYYKRYPLSLLLPGELCIVIFDAVKYTSTHYGIRRKYSWDRKMN